MLYPASDVNGTCSVNGIDVTKMVSCFKFGESPTPCEQCLPVPLSSPAISEPEPGAALSPER